MAGRPDARARGTSDSLVARLESLRGLLGEKTTRLLQEHFAPYGDDLEAAREGLKALGDPLRARRRSVSAQAEAAKARSGSPQRPQRPTRRFDAPLDMVASSLRAAKSGGEALARENYAQAALDAARAGSSFSLAKPVSDFVATTPWEKHPDLAESVIPIWGSAREAIADGYEGDIGGAVLNGILAVSDLSLGEAAVRGAVKLGAEELLRKKGSQTWNSYRKWMLRRRLIDPWQPGHHALIPQKGWGAQVPEAVKNHPLNIKPMSSAEVHGRVHGPYKGKPQFNPVEQYVHGTPAWWKIVNAEAVGRPAAALEEGHKKR